MFNQDEFNKVIAEIMEYEAKGEVPFPLVERFARICAENVQTAKAEVLKLGEVVKNGTADMKVYNEKLIRQKKLAEDVYLLAWKFLEQKGLLNQFKKYLASFAEPHPTRKSSLWQYTLSLLKKH